MAGIGFVAILVDIVFGSGTLEEPLAEFTGIVLILHAIPALALNVRRLHDSRHSGWWALLLPIPLVGYVATVVFGCLPSSMPETDAATQPSFAPIEPPSDSAVPTGAPLDASSSTDQLAKIEKLAELRRSGLIDEHEYRSMKAGVLGNTTP